MKPFDDLRSRRRGAVRDGAPPGDQPDGGRARVGMVFSREARWGGSAGAVGGVGAFVALAAGWGESDHDYLLLHALAALPYMVVGTGLSHRAVREGPAEYRGFWQRWEAALAVGALASLAAVGSGVWHVEALAVLDVILLVATVPIWVSATVLMARAQAGRRDVTVDVLDALTAVIVLGAPGVLLVAEPIRDGDPVAFAVPFALCVLLAPAAVYLSLVNLARIPPGERATQAIGAVLACGLAVNVTLQLARIAGGATIPLPWVIAAHTSQMALILAVPLWAHRQTTGRLDALGPEQQVRAGHPMPYVSAVVLPALAVLVLATRSERPWGVPFLVVVLLATIVLNAVRYTLMSRETRRLHAELARMAEERRRLLANMVRALEDDRRRTVSELHTQLVGSLTGLATITRTASVTLPTDTALVVQETIGQLQDDLRERAEDLRRLMVAMRPPAFEGGGTGGPGDAGDAGDDETALGTALLAYASDLYRERATRTVNVHVDRELELDRSTMTIVYRIAQEALLNAARHARARTVSVAVTAQGPGILVEVHDDGVGFEPDSAADGSGLATMQLFTNLGRGELTVRSSPGRGTLVRSLLGVRPEVEPHPPAPRRHLRLVATPEPPGCRDADPELSGAPGAD
jgi:signal transduction histidine kinase